MKVIGIGGIYFKSQDSARLRSWYAKQLGVGKGFSGKDVDSPNQTFYTSWSPLDPTDKIFDPGKKEFVINYRVDDLKAMVAALRAKGFQSSMEETAEGPRAHLLDPEGNSVILSQPGKIFLHAETPDFDSAQSDFDSAQSDSVTGLGGVFFKANDVKNLNEWYKDNLGLDITEWGCSFQWMDPKNPEAKEPASTAWSTFPSTTTHFAPSQKEFMMNYRVKDLHALLAALKSAGVESVADLQEASYGKFGWIVDPEGNKIELWEPVDGGF